MKCNIILLVFLSVSFKIQAAPAPHVPHVNCMLAEMENCELNSGPVCGIDDSGITETFENQCMAYVVACQRDTFFAEVKPGEC